MDGETVTMLLTRVPYLEAYNRVRITVDDPLRHEARADRGGRLGWIESSFAVPRNEGGLADALGAENDDFGLQRGHVDVKEM